MVIPPVKACFNISLGAARSPFVTGAGAEILTRPTRLFYSPQVRRSDRPGHSLVASSALAFMPGQSWERVAACLPPRGHVKSGTFVGLRLTHLLHTSTSPPPNPQHSHPH